MEEEVYPILRDQFVRHNQLWDQAREQEEGKRLAHAEYPQIMNAKKSSTEQTLEQRTHKDQGSRKNKKGGGRDNSSVEDRIPFKWLSREDDGVAEEDHDLPSPVLSTSSEDEDERIGRTERGQPINRESLKSPTTAENSPREPGSYPSKPMPPNYGYAKPHKD
ncbi:hypothetical protein OEA41_005648 [Lepraria neglecta]|uniref:Uncharacterized protein n=1 Tax=Lepraria neglecta TaxID=209136 RepID=A0AAD9Z9R6_9LECA|nr:hypothetical protein OEA41_005648 [Lepraria neglecta]